MIFVPDDAVVGSSRRSQLGEVRVKVTLRNALDQALARRGQLPAAQVRTYQADALVDTGAVRCVLPPHVVQDAMVLGDEVMIGRTAREKLDLVVDCAGRQLIPNPAHPDQSVSKVK